MLGWKAWPKNSTNLLKMGSQEEIGAELKVGHSVQIRGRLNARLSKTLDSANSGSGKGGGYRFSNYAEKGGTTDSGASSFGFATIHNSFITFVLYGGLLKSYYDLSPGGAVRPYAMN